MKNNMQLMKYKKDNFFKKIKDKIIYLFSKKKQDNIRVNQNNNSLDVEKKRFFETYEKIKKQEIDIQTLDKETIKKILLMTAEELKINNKKIEAQLRELKM